MVKKLFRKKVVLLGILLSMFFSAASVFAGNPITFLNPSNNILDPGSPNTSWGGCGPFDSHCYVVPKKSNLNIPIPKNTETKKVSSNVATISNQTLISALRNLLNGGLPADILAKLKGPKGDAGLNGTSAYIPATYIAPNPSTNYGGGSLFGATDLSAQNFITTNAKVTTLNVTGNTDMGGSLSVVGNSSFHGATTLDNTFSQTGSNTFSTGTGAVSLNGATSVNDILNVTGRATFTKVPTLAHAFTTWPLGTSNVSDASVYINPASAEADTNIFGVAVNGNVKFLVDAEGDIYANNLVLQGSVTSASNTIGTLNVTDNTTLGDAGTDTVTINANTMTFNNDTNFVLPGGTNGLSFDTDTLSIDALNKRVGIGTTAPLAKLQVAGDLMVGNRTYGRMRIYDDGTNLNISNDTADRNINIVATGRNITSGFNTNVSLANGNIYFPYSGNNYFNNGNVGIGTTTPGNILSINATSPTVSITRAANTNGALIQYYTATTADWLLGTRGTSNSDFHLYNYGTSADAITVLRASGNVGIGTTSPGERLEIGSDINAKFKIGRYDVGTGTAYITTGNNQLSLQVNNKDSLLIQPSGNVLMNQGNVGIGTTAPSQKLEVVGDYTVFTSTDYINGTQGNRLRFYTPTLASNYTGIQSFRTGSLAYGDLILNQGGGNVGIGTTSPGYLLDVNGTARIGNADSTGIYIGGTQRHIWARSSGALAIGTGGGDKVTIDSTGNVGIGTTAPGASLHVYGSGANPLILERNSALANVSIQFKDTSGSWFAGKGTTSGNFVIGTDVNLGASTIFNITSSGNVGIGTTSPSEKLEVNGNILINVAIPSLKFNSTIGQEAAIRIQANSLNRWVFGKDNGAESGSNAGADFRMWRYADDGTFLGSPILISRATGKLTLANELIVSGTGNTTIAGNVGIGTTAPTYTLDVNGTTNSTNYRVNSVLFASKVSATQIQVGSASDYDLSFYSGGVDRMYIARATGNVGIGTTSPGAKLDVNGGAVFAGNILPSAATTWNLGASGTQWGHIYTYNETVSNQLNLPGSGIWNSSGNVGIGTTAPGARLEISGGDQIIRRTTGGSPKITFITNDTTTVGNLYYDYNNNLLRLNNGGDLGININGTTGNVGIGTTSPTSKLTITKLENETIAFANDVLLLEGSSSANNRWGFRIDTSGNLSLDSIYSAVEGSKMFFNRNGNVGIGTTAPGSALSVVGKIRSSRTSYSDIQYLEMDGGDAAGIYLSSVPQVNIEKPFIIRAYSGVATPTVLNNIQFQVGATPATKMTIDYLGNVGIGTTAPAAKLEIAGDVLISANSNWVASSLGRIYKNSAHGLVIKGATGSSGDFGITSNDGNWLLYNPTGTNNVALVKDLGNVGIGTTSPGSVLDIRSNTAPQLSIMYAADPTYYLTVGNNGIFNLGAPASNYYNFKLNGSSQMIIDRNGNVGIGTTAPGQKLHISDVAPTLFLQETDGDVDENFAISVFDGDLRFNIGNDAGVMTGVKAVITNAGNVGIGTTNPGSKLEISGTTGSYFSGIGFTPSGTGARNYRTYIDTSGSFNIDDATSAATRLTIASSGNVGIGTTAPQAKLDVVGADGSSSAAPTAFNVLGGTGSNATFSSYEGGPIIIRGGTGGRPNSGSSPGSSGGYINITGGTGGRDKEGGAVTITSGPAGNYNGGVMVGGLSGANLNLNAGSGTAVSANANNYGSVILNSLGGNVGIGISNPAALFEVNQVTGGKGVVSTTATSTTVTGYNTEFTNTFKVGDTITVNGETRTISAIASNTSMTTDAWTNSNSTTYYTLVGGKRFSVLKNGNVGIGITNPGYKLQVSGVNNSTTGIVSSILGNGTAGAFLHFSNTVTGNWSIGHQPTTDSFSFIYGREGTTAGTPIMTMLSSGAGGNVGIGTTSPGALLQIGNVFTFRNDGVMKWGTTANYGIASWDTGKAIIGGQAGIDLGLYADGSQKMVITTTGNVGIGTTNPGTKLEVSGGSARILGNGASATGVGVEIDYGGFGTGVGRIIAYDRTSAVYKDLITGNGLIIKGDTGNVGIGTTAPAKKLVVLGGNGNQLDLDNAGERYTQMNFNNSGVQKAGIWFDNTDGYLDSYAVAGKGQRFFTNATEIMRITSGGNVGIGTTSPADKLDVVNSAGGVQLGIDGATVSDTQLRFYSGGTLSSFLYRPGSTNDLRFYLGGDRMTILSTGSVGIGTTSPVSALHVGTGITPTWSGATYTQVPQINNQITTAGGEVGYGMYINESTDNLRAKLFLNDTSGVYGLWSTASTNYPNFVIGAGTTEFMRVLGSNGNVGIGTTSPQYKLDISDWSRIYSDGRSAQLRLERTGTNAGFGYIGADSLSDFIVMNAAFGVPFMVQKTSGNVGIGTTAPGAKLTVSVASESVVPVLGVSSTFLNIAGSNAYGIIAGVLGSGKTYIQSQRIDGTATAYDMLLQPNGGNVGIGTTSPADTLNYGKALDIQSSTGAAIYLRDSDDTSKYGLVSFDSAQSRINIGAIGTGQYLRFLSATNEAMRIDSTGNVGIGTTAPGQKLDIVGNIALNHFSTGSTINRYIGLGSTNGELGTSQHWGGIHFSESATDAQELHFWTSTGGGAGTEKMTILGNGNVGIGTTSPGYKLEVTGTIYAGVGDGTNVAIKNDDGWATLLGSSSSLSWEIGQYDSIDEGQFVINVPTSSKSIIFGLGSVEKMRIASSGNVGIGTTNPGAKLDVAGDIKIPYGSKIIGGDATRYLTVGTGTGNPDEWVTYGGVLVKTYTGGTYNEKFRITSTGNVGIGTTGPGQLLHIRKDQDAATKLFIDNAGVTSSASKRLSFGSAGTEYAYLDLNGNSNKLMLANTSPSVAHIYLTPGTGGNLIIDSGNVGIGTTAPQALLHVADDGGTGITVQRTNVTYPATWRFRPSLYSPGGDLAIHDAISAETKMLIAGNGDIGMGGAITADAMTGALLVIKDSGNVGIGTTAPTTNLQIVAPNKVYSGGQQLQVFTNNTGAVNLGGSIGLGGDTNGAGYFDFGGISGRKENSTAGNYSGYLQFTTSQNAVGIVERMRIDSTGNVGIGTTAPTSKLSVIGNIDVSGTVDGRDVSVDGANLDTLVNPLGENVAEVIYIDTAGNDANDGLTWGTAKLTVQAAVNLIPKNLKGKTYILAMHPGTYETNGSYIELRNKMNGEIRFQTFSQTLNAGVSDESVFFRGNATNPIRNDTALVVLRGVNSRVFSSRDENVWLANSSNLTISFVGVNYEAAGKDATQYYYLDHPFTLNSTGNNALFNMGQTQKLVIAPSGVTFDATNNTKSSDWVDVVGTKVVIYALNIIGSLTNGSTTGTAWNSGVFLAGSNLDLTMLNVQHWEFIYYGKTTIAETKSYVFSGVRNLVKSLSNASYGTAKVNINFAPRNGNESLGLGLSYTQGVLPDAAVPKIDVRYNTTGFISTLNTFAELLTNNESDILFESNNTTFGRVMPIPTTDPLITGAIWNNNGMIRASGSTNPIYLDSSGNVGIGTTNPGQKLDITNGNIKINDGYWMGASVYNSWGLNSSGVTLANSSADMYFNIDSDASSADRSFIFAKDRTLSSGGTELMRITETGNVGIGTTAPLAQLSLGSSLANTKFATYDDGTYLMGLGIQSNDFRLHLAHNGQAFNFYDAPAGNSLMTIKGSGNVGIGTTSPGYKLDVVGDIRIPQDTGSIIVGDMKMYSLYDGNYGQYYGNATLTPVSGNKDGVFRVQPNGTGANSVIELFNTNHSLTTYSRGHVKAWADRFSIASTGYTNSVYDAAATLPIWFEIGPENPNSIKAMAITVAGNVGIGTTAPLGKLDVMGANVADTSSNGLFNLFTTDSMGANLGGKINFGGSYTGTTQTGWASIAGRKENATDTNYAGYLSFSTRASGLAPAERMRITSTGNVGIGTTAPNVKLRIAGTTAGTASIISDIGNIEFYKDATPSKAVSMGMAPTGGAITDDFIFSTFSGSAWSERMRITNGGNVGIGTTAPESPLHIVGTGGSLNRENFLYATVSDAPAYSMLAVGNSTANNSMFEPVFSGSQETVNRASLIFNGLVNTSLDSGTVPVVFYTAKAYTNGNHPFATQTYLPIANKPLFAWQNFSTTVMQISANGNVGIGTTAPSAKLHVRGHAIFGRSGDDARYWEIGADTGTIQHVQNGIVETQLGFTGGATWIGASSGTSGSGAQLYMNSSGNVGIGTTAPGNLLTLEKNVSNYIDIRNTGGTNNLLIGAETGLNSLISRNLSTGAIPLRFMVGTTEAVRIDNTGNVGIGTTAPGELLSIAKEGAESFTTNTSYYNSVNAGGFGIKHARGTAASPSGLLSGDYIGNIFFTAYNSSGGFSNTAGIRAITTEDHTATNRGTALIFENMATGTITRTEKMRIDGTGNVGIGTTAPLAKLSVVDGAMLFSGTTGATPTSGAGTRMMWIPAKNAFRAGSVTSTQWDDANIGTNSFAAGLNNTVAGIAATAFGAYNTASGNYSLIFGNSNTVSGNNSIVGGNYASASGNYALSVGASTVASGHSAVALGYQNTASGQRSFAIGDSTTASSFDSAVFGRYNVGGGTADSWVATDPLFEIGIGTASNAKANALTVLKNGNVGIGTTAPSASLTVVRAGTPQIAFRDSNVTGYSEAVMQDNTGGYAAGFGWGNSSANWKYANTVYLKSFRSGSYAPMKFMQDNGAVTKETFVLDSNYNARVQEGNLMVFNSSSTGVEKVTNGTFETDSSSWTVGAGWSYDGVNKRMVHTAGNTAALEQNISAVAGGVYSVVFTITNSVGGVGSVTVELGGVTGEVVQWTYTSTGNIVATTTGNLRFIPSTDWNGTIDTVSVKPLVSGNIKMGGLLTALDGSSGLKIDSSGNVGIGTTAPNKKLSLSSASADGASMTLEHTSLTHGITGEAPTTAFGYLRDINGANGGLQVAGFSDAGTDTGLKLYGVIGAADPTDTVPAVLFEASKANGTARQALGAAETAYQFRTYTTNLITILGAGNVGIGTTAPTGKLEVALDASSKVAFTDAFNNFQANVYSADAVAPNFVGIKGRGSLASPTAALANDGLMFIGGRGYPSTTINAGAIRILASENFTASAAGTYITFETTPNGSLSKVERLRIDNAGNVGINMTNPSVALDVTGDIEYTGTITDVSDERLKENIIPLTGGLVKVMGIEAKYFNMKDTPDRVDLGFLAQNVKEYVPEAVSIVDPINGYMGVSYTSLIPVAFEAIKELNLNINAITGTITPLEGSTSETFAKAFFDNVYSKMRTWLASAENGIEDFYANRMRAKELCIGDESGETCITKTQLDTLLANAGMSAVSTSPSSSSGSSGGDIIAPVITLNGEVTINLNVGDTYNEEGASAVDDVDGSVAVIISGNVDTSTNGIYTITYSASDGAGNNTTLTRTVNVGDVSSISTPTPEPTPEPIPEPTSEPAPTEEIVPVSEPVSEPAL